LFFLLGTKYCWKKLWKLWVPEPWRRMDKVNNDVMLCLAETSHTAKHINCGLTVETSQNREYLFAIALLITDLHKCCLRFWGLSSSHTHTHTHTHSHSHSHTLTHTHTHTLTHTLTHTHTHTQREIFTFFKNVPTRWHFLYSILFPANSSTCFEWNIHPSSGARINCSYSIW
jgi:hypothetical protein